MALHFAAGPAGCGKSRLMQENMIQWSMEREGEEFLFLVPDQFTMQTQIEMAQRHPRKGLFNIDVLSFNRLAYRIFEKEGKKLLPVLEDLGKTMVLTRVAQQKKKELGLLKQSVKKPGYVLEMKSLVSELMQYRVSEETLKTLAGKNEVTPLLREKLKDIHVLYQGFHEFLEGSYATSEELLDIFAKVLEQTDYLKNTTVVLDGFTGFTPVQLRLITSLLGRCRDVWVTITLDEGKDLNSEGPMHHRGWMSRRMSVSLLKCARQAKTVVEEPLWITPETGRFRGKADLAFLEKRIFDFSRETYRETPEHIRLFAAENPRIEMEEVARRIHQLVRTRGWHYKDIAVITADMETYGREALQALKRSGMPVFLDSTRSILQNPAAELLSALMEIMTTSFSRDSVMRYLRTGFSCITREEADEFENYLLALGIRGRSRFEQPFLRTCKTIDPARVPAIETMRRQLMEELTPFTTALRARDRRVIDVCRALYQCMVSLRVQDKLEAMSRQLMEDGEGALAAEYSQIYGALMDMLDKFAEILGDEEVSLKDMEQLVLTGLAGLRSRIIPPTSDYILIGDVTRTRLPEVKALFFVGVNDQVIPGSAKSGGIFSETDREILKSFDVQLSPTAREELYIQKFYLYQHLTKPEELLCLSYAAGNLSGEQTGPSYLYTSLLKLFPEVEQQLVFDEHDPDRVECRFDLEDGIPPLIRRLDRQLPDDKERELLSRFMREEKNRRLLEGMLDEPGRTSDRDAISRAAAKALYGTASVSSVSRLERFAACAYAHFLQYGLGLSQREEFSLGVVDLGSILHEAMEKFGDKARKEGYGFGSYPEERVDALISTCLEEIFAGYNNRILSDSAANKYHQVRIRRLFERSIRILREELIHSDFEPSDFELVFGGHEPVTRLSFDLGEGDTLRLQGKIDRIDTCTDEEGLWVRIIDYKSGKAAFDPEQLYLGLQLQLLTYLSAAMEIKGTGDSGRPVIPAAMLYYHLADPLVDISDGKDAEELRHKELRMAGLLAGEERALYHLDNTLEAGGASVYLPVALKKDGTPQKGSPLVSREDFDLLMDFACEKAKAMGRQIMDGDTKKKPVTTVKKNILPCEWCSYSAVCGFTPGTDGEAKAMGSTEEIMERIRTEAAARSKDKDTEEYYGR